MSASVQPEAVGASDLLLQPVVSPDGSKVLYRVRPQYRAPDKDHWTSALWIADVDGAGCARQLTSGSFNDYDAVFAPDGHAVMFLSDRHKAGGSAHIYSLPLMAGGEAVPLTDTSLKKGASSFILSPDGKCIAYSSADEPTAEDDAKEKKKDDAVVWSDKKSLSRLRLVRLATRTTATFNLPADMHVNSFAWRADGQQLVVCMTQHSRLELLSFEASYYSVSLRDPNAKPQFVAKYQDAFASDLSWLADGTMLEVRFHNPQTVTSAHSVVKITSDEHSPIRSLYAGTNDDAQHIVDLKHEGFFAVEVVSGLSSLIEVVHSSGDRQRLVYQTDEDALSAWDIKRLEDGSLIFACLRSSGPRKEPWNVWAGKLGPSSAETFSLTKLSSHHKWQEDVKWETKTEEFRWTARDGTKLEGLISKPTNAKAPFPTVLVVHGGPYYRDTPALSLSFGNWHTFLAAAGFCTISPNYRGSSGRGSAFAETMRGGVGTVDWTDCEDMVDAAVARGIADPKSLGIGGWSQGGFMTAWGVAQTKNKFKAACMGAGVSDWGAMSAESDLPEFETALGGSAPWTSPARPRNDPVNHVKDVETAVLILHGEKDERVPVGQAVGYFRGLRREAKFPERCGLVIYPREPHDFIERTHAEDVLKRVLDHFTSWLM